MLEIHHVSGADVAEAVEGALFWHRGPATTDVALWHLIHRRALDRGVDRMLPYPSP